MEKANWDDYIEHAQRYLRQPGRIEEEELDYKRAAERDLKTMRDAVLAGDTDWAGVMKKAYFRKNLNNLCDWRGLDHLERWFQSDPQGSRTALQRLWALGDLSRGAGGQAVSAEEGGDRISRFRTLLPQAVISGAGTRMRVIAALLMALGAERYPPFQRRTFGKTYKRIGYSKPPRKPNEAELYAHALGFLDRLVEEAQARGFDRPGDRLEAQSVVWALENQFADG